MGNMTSENETDDSGETEEQRRSKSARKREAASLQELGVKLSALPDQEIKALDLPENLFVALRDLRRLPSHGAQVRQRQYIGKLMRNIDPEPVLAKLAERKQRHDLEIRHFQQIERWRDRLLSEPAPRRRRIAAGVSASRPRRRWPSCWKRPKESAWNSARRSVPGNFSRFCASCSDRLGKLAPMKALGRNHHGIVFRLGDDAGCGRYPRLARDRARSARRLGASHTRPAVRVRRLGARARPQGHHCRGRRRCAPAGHDGRQDLGSGARRADSIQDAERHRFTAVDRANAERNPGGHLRHRRRRGEERRAVRGGDSRERTCRRARRRWTPSARRRPPRCSPSRIRAALEIIARRHRRSRSIGAHAGAGRIPVGHALPVSRSQRRHHRPHK